MSRKFRLIWVPEFDEMEDIVCEDCGRDDTSVDEQLFDTVDEMHDFVRKRWMMISEVLFAGEVVQEFEYAWDKDRGLSVIGERVIGPVEDLSTVTFHFERRNGESPVI